VSNQHIRMISEGSFDTGVIAAESYILKYIQKMFKTIIMYYI